MNRTHIPILIVAAVLLFGALSVGSFDIEEFITREYYQGNEANFEQAKKTGNVIFCDKHVEIHALAPMVDGANIFIRRSDGAFVASCGGACWHPPAGQEEKCAILCPELETECTSAEMVVPPLAK